MNLEFRLSYHILEDIVEYIEDTAKGKCKSMKWENIKYLLRLEVTSGKITEEQYKFLIETYCREK